jgi:hypothetical protein
MTSAIPCAGVLAALMCWAGAAQAPGLPADGSDNPHQAKAGPAQLDGEARSALAVSRGQLEQADLMPRARAYGLGAAAQLAAAWNKALEAEESSLPGLFSPQTAEVRARFVDAPDADLFFNVEQACLAVGCMTEIAFSGEGEADHDNTLLPENTSVVPVPPAMLLFGSALGALAWLRRRAA